MTVDGMLEFLPTKEAKAKFGEKTANRFYEHAKELKVQGAVNSDTVPGILMIREFIS